LKLILFSLANVRFEAETYILLAAEGGRSKPFHSGYRPQFFVRTANVTGEITLPDGVAACLPGDKVFPFSQYFITFSNNYI
jgi:elongation factor Tu